MMLECKYQIAVRMIKRTFFIGVTTSVNPTPLSTALSKDFYRCVSNRRECIRIVYTLPNKNLDRISTTSIRRP